MIWIGDVHGHYDHLVKLLKKLPSDEEIGFLGDIIDRGPRPLDCLDLAFDVSDNILMGNHEEMMLLSLGGDDVSEIAATLWYRNGGKSMINLLNETPRIIQKLKKYGQKMQVFIETSNAFACHAGVGFTIGSKTNVRETIDRQSDLIFGGISRMVPPSRKGFLTSLFLWEFSLSNSERASKKIGKKIICGHKIVSAPYISEKLIMIDTSAYGNNLLTAYSDETGEIWQSSI